MLTAEDTRHLLYRITSTEQQKQLELNRQLDMSYSIPGVARFRVNLYSQRESLAGAFRLIPTELKTLEELGMPQSLYGLCQKPRGLVLVTGPTGLGQVDDPLGADRRDQPDPVGPHHHDRRPDRVPPQAQEMRRQPAGVGPDATTFADALRGALRRDPVILLGEMRDHETISTALTAAETGHLVSPRCTRRTRRRRSTV